MGAVRTMRLPKEFRLTMLVGISMTLFLGAAVLAKFGPRKFGPMRTESGSCLLCGRHIQIEKFTGSPRETIITDTEVSAWVDRFVPATHRHVWSFHSWRERDRWFGDAMIACGGGEPGVEGIWLVGRTRGWDTAESLLREYVTLASDKEARAEFIADAVSPRLKD
jgi:hypothetical protein